MKIKEIIEKIEAYHAPLDPDRPTDDGVIVGDTEQECTGIITTCCPTAAVIQEAIKRNCNFIIGHEPTFFDGMDETDWLQDNSVYLAKKALIEQAGVVIYRNHDRIHSDKPDGIFSGLTKKLGWEQYVEKDSSMIGDVYSLPKTTVREIAKHLAEVMNIDGIRMIGDPDMEVTRVANVFHFLGVERDQNGIDFIDRNDIQVIIPGEVIDWTIGEYVQDAVALGKKRALLNVGHFNWEEPGMEYMAEWLPKVIGTDVPVTFVQSGNSYRWLDFSHR